MKRCILIIPAALFGLYLVSCGGLLLEEPPGTEDVEFSAIQATAITTTSATITWSTNVPTTHVVEYGLASGSYSESTLQTANADTAHTVNLSGLSEGTTYYYRVKNYNLSLADTSSAEHTFTTIVTPPPTPEQRLRGIWLFGGLAGSTYANPVQQVDLYDPVTDTWYANVTSLPTPVSFAGAASYGGRIFVFGGFTTAGTAVPTVQIYTVSSDTWTTGTDMLAVRANIHAATVNDKIYVLGGTTGNASALWAASNLTYEYTPGGTWITKANYAAVNHSERCLLPFNDVIYNLGGRTSATVSTTAHDGFAATTNGLSQGTEVVLSSGRTGISGVLYAPTSGPALMAIVGGFITPLTATTGCFVAQGTTNSTPTNLFQYLYYPFTSPPATWTNPASQYPLSIGFGSAALSGSKMFVFGGTTLVTSAANGLNNAYWFDLSNLSGGWTAAASLPTGRYGHCAVAVRQ
jgi:N-acetylneuraminic acid mutarotase